MNNSVIHQPSFGCNVMSSQGARKFSKERQRKQFHLLI